MNGLLSARVAVIDDDVKEAMTLITALGRRGVAAVYCSGQPGEYPPQPISTLRLVFLDLYLMQSTNIGAVVRSTADALSRVADLTSPGLGILLWTKHPKEEQQPFIDAMKEQFPNFRPLFLMAQEKLAYLEKPELLDQLIADIERKLAESPGARLLFDWEQFIHIAAASSGNLLASLAANDAGVVDMAAAMVRAIGGVGGTEAETLGRFFEAVNPILLDSIGAGAKLDTSAPAHVGQLHTRAKDRFKLTPAQCAGVNRVLMTAAVKPGQSDVIQGNVYLNEGWGVTKAVFPVGTDDAGRRGELYTLFPLMGSRDDKDAVAKWKAWVSQLAAKAIGCAVEISPACDIANRKCVFARLLGGMLLKDEDDAPAPDIPPDVRVFAKQLPRIELKDPARNIDGRYSLVVNARNLVTVAPGLLKNVQPFLRIRESVAVDIQAWFSGHAARPGFVAVF